MTNRLAMIRKTFFLFLAILLLVSASGCGRSGGAGGNPYKSNDKVALYEDIVYYDGSAFKRNSHILDVYVPKGKKNYPVIFFIHGGAWIGGDKNLIAEFGMRMATRGIGVVSPNYRFWPGAEYPKFVLDVARAFEWTVNNISKFGGDPGKIFIGGHSAGGHLSALLATNDRFLKKYGNSLRDIRGVIGVSGVYDVEDRRMTRVFTGNLGDASPLRHVTSKTPPFLLIYADDEMEGLGELARDMYQELKDNNVPCKIYRIKNRTHNTVLGKIGHKGDPTFGYIVDFVEDHQ